MRSLLANMRDLGFADIFKWAIMRIQICIATFAPFLYFSPWTFEVIIQISWQMSSFLEASSLRSPRVEFKQICICFCWTIGTSCCKMCAWNLIMSHVVKRELGVQTTWNFFGSTFKPVVHYGPLQRNGCSDLIYLYDF